jgi:hypothetical protein
MTARRDSPSNDGARSTSWRNCRARLMRRHCRDVRTLSDRAHQAPWALRLDSSGDHLVGQRTGLNQELIKPSVVKILINDQLA